VIGRVERSSSASAPARAGADAVPVVRVAGLAKAFGATQALRGCSFEVRPGEVHALVGENGSGKSTAVKVLAGVHRPDAGTVQFGGGSPVRALRAPRVAHGAGVAVVFQEILVVGPSSVLDNVWLGTEGIVRARRSAREKAEHARAVLTELLGDAPGMRTPVEELSLSDRQAVSVARALVRDPRLLILDEATSALDVATRDRLFAILRRRCEEGTGVLFTSHRMDEIEEIADRVTVMRSGATVATLGRGEATARELVRLMTGADQLVERESGMDTRSARPMRDAGPVALRTRGLRLHHGAAQLDVAIHAGELVGLAGLEGHGQEAFLRALGGGAVAAGEVLAGSTPITSAQHAAAHGVVYVPRDRRAESLFATLSILENFGVPTLDRDARGGLVRFSRTNARFAEYVQRLDITLGRPGDLVTTLSGGNQQKVIMARWLAAEPRVLLLNDPTRGVDLGAKRDLYTLLERLAGEGVAVVMVSTELDEHVELMDRVLVFREQELAAEIPRGSLTRNGLVAAFFGRDRDGAGSHSDA
jgi:ABC-type sugar transport system ATPase subunit